MSETVLAAGGAVWRPAATGIETAVVHRPRYDDWSLPKGKVDAGESLLETAVREIAEETGLAVVVGRRSLRTSHPVADGTKQVDYWLMQAVGGVFEPNDETDELCWLPVTEAAQLVSHDHDRAVLADLARTDAPRTPSLLLVRHASAGEREDWDGDDDLRPLDHRGERQAARLAQVLPAFAPTSVLAAERIRCQQTVEPLATALGMPVQALPELGEEEFAADPEAGMAVLEELLAPRAAPGVTVVCSQGGAIPSILRALGVHTGGKPSPPSAKGSIWALGRSGGNRIGTRLLADYYREF